MSIRFAFGEFRLLHRRTEVLDNEIEGGYHEVVPTRLNRWQQCDERIGERRELKAGDAVE